MKRLNPPHFVKIFLPARDLLFCFLELPEHFIFIEREVDFDLLLLGLFDGGSGELLFAEIAEQVRRAVNALVFEEREHLEGGNDVCGDHFGEQHETTGVGHLGTLELVSEFAHDEFPEDLAVETVFHVFCDHQGLGHWGTGLAQVHVFGLGQFVTPHFLGLATGGE